MLKKIVAIAKDNWVFIAIALLVVIVASFFSEEVTAR